MRTTAFIITDVRLPERNAEPTDAQLRKAASQAIIAARKAQGSPDSTGYESFAIGSRQFRFIQGEFRTNLEQFGHLPEQDWPETCYSVMSQISEPDLTEDGLNGIPSAILRNSWNSARNLVALGLENRAAWGTGHPNRGLIYPDILLNTDGIIAHCLGWPDENVFGESDRQMDCGQAHRAKTYLPMDNIVQAHHVAKEPLRRLAKVQFQIEYLRTMSRYDTHIVLEADWNM